jgi:predicted ATPase
MRDVIFFPVLQQAFAGEDSYNTSLLRFDSAVRAIEDAPALLGDQSGLGGPSRGPLVFAFSTNVGGREFVINFKFADRKHIPSRINAVIGYNGTGKTRLLANLAIAASTDSHDRLRPEVREEGGSFDPKDINFGAVVAISYSAFDIFNIPSDDDSRYGYTYCGLRKIDDDGKNVLKSPEELTGDFVGALMGARNGRQKEIMIQVFDRLRQEPSFASVGLVEYIKGDKISVRDVYTQFERLSTGHKVVLNIAVHLVANLQRRSLLLIDEPELHLHPPLLAALLRALSEALEQRDSFAIIATHSPVVLQEVPGRYVSVLRRSGDQTLVQAPETETFGENVGFLTRTVFNLDSSATDHSVVLHNLAQFSLDDIERMFGNHLSNQARTYIMKLQRERPF